MAHACAELSARDPLATSAPARDVRDADNGVDDCGGVERDGEDCDEAEAGPVYLQQLPLNPNDSIHGYDGGFRHTYKYQ